jgi:cytochrome P450
MIGELLGVPRDDLEQIKGWSSAWSRYKLATDESIFLAFEAQGAFRAYVEDMLKEHRRAPDPTDLVSALVGAEHEETLTADECAAMFFTLLFGGHETTSSLIATGLLELLRRPDQWRALCDDLERVPAAVEELLRYVTPVQWITRRAVTDVELGGVTIPADAHVMPMLACANRDPAVFADPAELNVARQDVAQHVGLGFGQHFCIGASLARLEARTVVESMARRFPALELAADSFQWTGSAQLRKLKALPVRLAPHVTAA